MRESLETGVSFGLTSGIITTLGLMVGLSSGTNQRGIVIGGILTIAIADALSDALGIHISEESDKNRTEKQIWAATIATFFSKLIMALTFVVPVLLLDLTTAVYVSIAWGLGVLSVLSVMLSKVQGIKPWKAIMEHLVIACLVIFITHQVGVWVAANFH